MSFGNSKRNLQESFVLVGTITVITRNRTDGMAYPIILEKEMVTIGNDVDSDIRVRSKNVEALHCKLKVIGKNDVVTNHVIELSQNNVS